MNSTISLTGALMLLLTASATAQQTADALVDQADPTKTLKASSQPEIGDLLPMSETIFYDSVNKRLGVGKPSPDTTLHVYGNSRVWSNHVLTENLGQGALQVINIDYTKGWSADGTGLQSYGTPFRINPFGLHDVRVAGTLIVKPDGRVGVGMEPVHQLDVAGVLRASDTIVSGKPAGAPFLIASTDVSANLKADMLDGHHAEDFVLHSELGDLPTGGGGVSVSDLADRVIVADGLNLSEPLYDSTRGVIFPDGSVQKTAWSPEPVQPSSVGGSGIGTLTLAEGPPSTILAVEILQVREEDWVSDPILEVWAHQPLFRITKVVDGNSLRMIENQLRGRGVAENPNSEEPAAATPALENVTIELPRLADALSTARGLQINLSEAAVVGIRQRRSTLSPTCMIEEVLLGGVSATFEIGSYAFECGDPPQSQHDMMELIVEAEPPQPLRSSRGSNVELSGGGTAQNNIWEVRWDFAGAEQNLIVFDNGSRPEHGSRRGPTLDLASFDPRIFQRAMQKTSGSYDTNSAVDLIIQYRNRFSRGADPTITMTQSFDDVYFDNWRLRSDANGQFHQEVDVIYGQVTMTVQSEEDGPMETASWNADLSNDW